MECQKDTRRADDYIKELTMKNINFNIRSFLMMVFMTSLFLTTPHYACCLLLTFDDLNTGRQTQIAMPREYKGFHCEHANASKATPLHGLFGKCCSGYEFSSSDVDVLNDAGEAMTISMNENFTWLGASF